MRYLAYPAVVLLAGSLASPIHAENCDISKLRTTYLTRKISLRTLPMSIR